MKTLKPLAIAVVAAATAFACAPKKDTANPDGATACTEEAKVCEDGSSVSREGPDCEFPACPGEEVEAAADAGDELDEADAEAEADADADADAEAEAPAGEEVAQ